MRPAAALLATVALSACANQVAGPTRFIAPIGAVGDYAAPVRSVLEQKFDGVIHQQYDFSCGSAALATLLRYHYDLKVGEDDAFRGMWAKGDQGQIRRLGFSLLDMKRWLASHRLAADGYKVSLEKIGQTGVPGIALISIKNYRHFVVIKGVRPDEVLLGDPSNGLSIMPRAEFERAWNGIYFVLSADQARAKGQFNRDAQWVSFARAPIGGRFVDPVSQQALALTNPFHGDF